MGDIQHIRENTNIIGAGGLGREIVSWMKFDAENIYDVVGFWDDTFDPLAKYNINLGVLGKITDFISGNLHIGIMDTAVKRRIYETFSENPQIKICKYTHSSVIIGDRTELGTGVILFPKVIVSCDVQIGEGTFINLGSQIGHDVNIGKYVSIMPNVDLGGGCTIGDGVFIGSGATLLPGVTIAKNTRIGAGSVVLKSIKKEGTYFGNPAKKIF